MTAVKFCPQITQPKKERDGHPKYFVPCLGGADFCKYYDKPVVGSFGRAFAVVLFGRGCACWRRRDFGD
ncbi:hypothetical protein [Moraxella lacunata]|uniref:hypothetical protein n=1 Tax=Moraxella lacunata TaxID=477 RepID=UPI003EE1D7C5